MLFKKSVCVFLKDLINEFTHLTEWKAFCWTQMTIDKQLCFFSAWAEMEETGLWADDQTEWEPLSGSPKAVHLLLP